MKSKTSSNEESGGRERLLMAEQEELGLTGGITNAVPVGICLTRDHVICFANTSLIKMTGYSAVELRDQDLSLFFSGENSIERSGNQRNDSGSQGFFRSQDRWICKDGSILYCSVRCCPVDERPGEQIWVIADISERIRLEAQRHELEQQLLKAQKMEALGILAGGIAHDFNNILSPIMGYAQLLLIDTRDQTQKRYISGILKAAERSRDIIAQILSFSRRQEEAARPIRIQPIAKEIVKLLTGIIPATIRVQIHTDPKCGRVLADPSQIYQMIMNLCTNAYQAMAEKGGTLTVRVSHLKAGDGIGLSPIPHVAIIVSDTGPGMAEKVKKHIFKPYYTTKPPDIGTGLGLAMVHSIVQQIGGIIRVNSSPGCGAKFSIFLPELEKKKEQNQEKSLDFTKGIRGTGHILLVDDEPEVSEIIEAMLIYLGYEVTAVDSSTQAIKLFEHSPQKFDVVITDQTMPDITGIQLASSIKSLRLDIPVVLHTGYSNVLPTPDNNLIDAILPKPVDVKKLGRILSAALQCH
ncbi:ATP-binding protein [Desulfobacter vibrioformis]|uniref:ATP-binding protein n=1 Tax=Desulfobacter vibrioformis TaxID=34031 RepID=UPI00068F9ADC|nr:ATP-binding protein [Desulfobacter vibrioformis]